MSKLLFSVINPIVKTLLRSPLHGVMSRNTMLLEFKGRKSGKTYTTPVSYREAEGQLQCFTDKANRWWRNLEGGDDVAVTLRGQRRTGTPTVRADGSSEMQEALRDLLVTSPRDAAHAGVAFDAAGEPVASDLADACEKLVLLSIALHDAPPTAPPR